MAGIEILSYTLATVHFSPFWKDHDFRNSILSVVLLLTSMGAPVMVELEGQTDPLQIAMKELK